MLSKYKVSQAHNKAIFLFSQYGHRYGYSRSRTTQPKEEHVDRSFRECENSKDANDECLMWRLRRYATSFIICVTTRITKDTDGHWGPFNICPSQPAEWKEMAGLVKFISQHGRVPANKNQHEPAWCMQVHAGPRMLPHVWDMLEKTLWRPQSLRMDCLTGQAFFLCHAKPHNQHSQHFLAAWS